MPSSADGSQLTNLRVARLLRRCRGASAIAPARRASYEPANADAEPRGGRTVSAPGDRFAAAVRRLTDSVLNGRGDLAPAARHAIADRTSGRTDGNAVPEALASYVDTIARHAYRVTREQVDALRVTGLSEDAIFEATIAAALGAALLRLERGLAAVRGEG
jgi:alkylhydroperoxidase family enzyme